MFLFMLFTLLLITLLDASFLCRLFHFQPAQNHGRFREASVFVHGLDVLTIDETKCIVARKARSIYQSANPHELVEFVLAMSLSVRAAMSRHGHSVATMQHEKASFLCLFVCTLNVCYHFSSLSLLLWPLANHNAVDPEDRQFRRMGQPASANVRRDQRVRFCELFIGCRDMLRILVPCHATCLFRDCPFEKVGPQPLLLACSPSPLWPLCAARRTKLRSELACSKHSDKLRRIAPAGTMAMSRWQRDSGEGKGVFKWTLICSAVCTGTYLHRISLFSINIIFSCVHRNCLSCPGGVGNSARKGETTRVGLREQGFDAFCLWKNMFLPVKFKTALHQSYCRALRTEGSYRGYANFQDEEKANHYLDESAFWL